MLVEATSNVLNEHMVKTEDIGPKDAALYLSSCDYEGQRNYRKWWSAFLGDQMDKGKFATGTPIHLAIMGSDIYLIDGRHRLTAVRDFHKNPIRFTVVYHRVESPEDIAALYSRLDQGLKRSTSDTYGAWQLNEKTGLNNTALRRLTGAVRFIDQGFGLKMARIDIEKQIDLILDWTEEARMFYENVSGGDLGTLIFKAPVLAVGLVTFKHEQEIASEFWNQVSFNDGLGRNDPRSRLHTWLLLARAHGANSNTANAYSRPQISLMCARCWTAHIDGQELSKLYLPGITTKAYAIKNTNYGIGPSRKLKTNV